MGARSRRPGLLRSAGVAIVLGLAVALLMSSCTAPAPRPHPSSRPQLVVTQERLHGRSFGEALTGLAAIAAHRDADLVLPRGRYTAAGTIVLPPRTHLRMRPGAHITGDLPGRPVLRISASSTITGGAITNGAASPGFDLDVAEHATSITIDAVTFSGTATNAVYLAAPGIRDVLIQRSRFDGVGYGILLNPGAIDAQDIVIRKNVFRHVCSDAIEINAATGGTSKRVRNVHVVDNDIDVPCGSGDSSGFGVGFAGVEGFTVSGNVFLSVRSEAVHLEDGTSRGTVSGNRIESGGVGYRPAIALYRSTSRIVVHRNTIARFDGSGIAVLWDQMGSASDVTVDDNTVQHVTGDGVIVAGDRGTGPFVVSGNRISNVGGDGVSVAGPHAESRVVDNTLHAVAGKPIGQTLRGGGRTTVEGNVVR